MEWLLAHFDRESRIALLWTLGVLIVIAFSVAVLYLLVSIHQLEGNHANSVRDFKAICSALPRCVFPTVKP